ncbi:hypothetical protein DUNSADRAFT_16834, partial [Dunaliella salina]
QNASVHVQLESDRYYPGQTVRGTAHVHATEAMDTGGIFLKAIGEMRTKWWESYGQTCAQYVGKEPVMKGEQMLAEKGTIMPGYHSFPFDFSLPATAPASFDFDGDQDEANERYQSNGFKARCVHVLLLNGLLTSVLQELCAWHERPFGTGQLHFTSRSRKRVLLVRCRCLEV